MSPAIRPPARLSARLADERTAVSLVLGGVCLLAVAARLELASRIAAPQLLCDEFIYANVARNIAEHGSAMLRDIPSRQNLLYPAAIAPGWLFGPSATAYAFAKLVNVVAMTLAAVLAYLWSLRLVRPLLGLAVALLVLAMPWFEYTGLLMTENLFLPVFVGATFAAAVALERPTRRLQALALVFVAVAYATRTQGLVLLPVLATAVLFHALVETAATGPFAARRLLDVLRPWWFSAALVGGAAALYLLWVEVRGRSLSVALGDYSVILHWHRTAGDVVHWASQNLAAITVTSGIVPLAGTVALAVGVAIRPAASTPAERALAAVAAAVLVWMTVQVGIFATQVSSVVERYLFYVEPLLFLALVTWLSRRRPLWRVAGASGAVAALVLVLAVPQSDYASSILPNNMGMYGLYDLTIRVAGGVGRVETLLHLVAVVGLAALVLLPRRAALVVLLGGVGLWLAVSSYRVHPPIGQQAAGSVSILGGNKSWIDDAVGRDGNVSYLYSATPETAFDATRLSLETEFWNRSIRSVTAVQGNELCGLPEHATRLVAARDGVGVVPSPREPLVVASSAAPAPYADVIARGPQQTLYRLRGPLALQSLTSDISSDGWTGPSSMYVELGHRRGTIVATFSRPRWKGPDVPGVVTVAAAPATVRDLTVTATGAPFWRRRWTAHLPSLRTFRIPTHGRPTAVEITVHPTFSPAKYGQPDTRDLGVQAGFRFVPAQ